MQIILDKKCFQVNGWNRTELVKDIFDFGYTLLGRLIWSLKIQLHSSQKFKYLKNDTNRKNVIFVTRENTNKKINSNFRSKTQHPPFLARKFKIAKNYISKKVISKHEILNLSNLDKSGCP